MIARLPRFAVLAVLLALFAWVSLATAQTVNPPEPTNGGKIPRFVSLRSDEVNLRVGPGFIYPIDWVLRRRNMPVEVIAESDTWRKVRDWEGTEGWVHQANLAGRRYGIITGEIRNLRRNAEPAAPVVARLEPGVVAQIIECKDDWCRLDAGGFRGWLARAEFWGAYPNEVLK